MPSRRRLLGLGLAVLVSGCGWRPLYSRPSPDPASGGIGSELAKISIDPITTRSTPDPLTGSNKFIYDSRAAQLLHNYLRDQLNPYGQPSSADYHLAIELTESVHGSAALGNGQATRDDLQMLAKYELTNPKGVPVLRDFARIITSYDVVNEPFSDLASHNDALNRGTQQLAELIQIRLAVFLRK